MLKNIKDVFKRITTDIFALIDESSHFILSELNFFLTHFEHVFMIGLDILIIRYSERCIQIFFSPKIFTVLVIKTKRVNEWVKNLHKPNDYILLEVFKQFLIVILFAVSTDLFHLAYLFLVFFFLRLNKHLMKLYLLKKKID